MIRIDTSKIDNWNTIKEKHIKFIEDIIKHDYEKYEKLPEEIRKYINENYKVIFTGKRKEMLEKAKVLRKLTFNNVCEYELELLEVFKSTKKYKRDTIIKEINEKFDKKEYESYRKKLIDNINKIKHDKRITSDYKKNFISKYYPNYNIGLGNQENISQIFSYEKLTEGKEGWNRHELISRIGVKVCPYCNRQYISSYVEKNISKTTADLDHFYPKSRYPILALSLYNFIPSCQVCNSRFKLDSDFYLQEHIYPYDECFDDYSYKFTTMPTQDGGIDYLTGDSNEFNLLIKCKGDNECNKVEKSIATFKLNELYTEHKDYVREIIKKANLYNDDRINDIKDEFKLLFNSKEEVLRLIFSNYISSEDLSKRPLSKLTKDICEEFEISI